MQDTSDGLVVPHRDTVVGYGGSLILHGSILLLLSLIFLETHSDGGSPGMSLEIGDAKQIEFDEPLAPVKLVMTVENASQAPRVVSPPHPTKVVVDRGVADSVLSWAEQFDGEDASPAGRPFLESAAGGRVVKKGSFTAWTVPRDPEPDKEYTIVIQVKLPARVTRYRASDLSGMVHGTDLYVQTIPWDMRWPNVTLTVRGEKLVVVKKKDHLPIRDRKARLLIRVPPAERLVRDTIRIKSRLLKEEQVLEIVF